MHSSFLIVIFWESFGSCSTLAFGILDSYCRIIDGRGLLFNPYGHFLWLFSVESSY